LLWSKNIWMGVTVESIENISRVHELSLTSAAVKFLSCEPLLTALPHLPLDNIDWVIVGGESGAGARGMDREWVLDIQSQCIAWNKPFFFKQWGGVNKKQAGRVLNGKTYSEMPRQAILA